MQKRKNLSNGQKKGAFLWPDIEKHIHERFSEFRQKDLRHHSNLLKSWKSDLAKVSDWYKSSTSNFLTFTNGILKEVSDMEESDSCNNGRVFHDVLMVKKEFPSSDTCVESDGLHGSDMSIVAHDHTYCLRTTEDPGSVFVPHQCGRQCVDLQEPLTSTRCSPLQLPLQRGWQRKVFQCNGYVGPLEAVYVAPCGRKLRSLDEVRLFFDITEARDLKGVHFSFNPFCRLISTPFDPKQAMVYLPDISKGRENIPISCVNMFNRDLPDLFDYITRPSFEPGMPGLTSVACKDFLVCCDCTNSCVDRSKCACWQLTLEEAKVINNSQYSVGYVHHRLKRAQHSAVYECNSSCRCGDHCSNRVVQEGVVQRLQVFHTGDPQLRWGLRTLDDIPKGTFVCSYIGHIYTEMDAEKKADKHGDEYFADLDYIEVMERHKAGYEPEVLLSDDTSSVVSGNCGSMETTPTNTLFPTSASDSLSVTTPSACDTSSHSTSDSVYSFVSTSASCPSSLSPPGPSSPSTISTSCTGQLSIPQSSHRRSDSALLLPGSEGAEELSKGACKASPKQSRILQTRQFFLEEFTYVTDAKQKGNVGRFINHCCSPNLFVQNVFVDTHDLRFPWVAFFASREIKALQELTWDYNYEIGSVENKVIQCRCAAPNCRQRLL